MWEKKKKKKKGNVVWGGGETLNGELTDLALLLSTKRANHSPATANEINDI